MSVPVGEDEAPDSSVYLPLPHHTSAEAEQVRNGEVDSVNEDDDHSRVEGERLPERKLTGTNNWDDRLRELRRLDENADAVLVANKDYQNTILATMQKIAHAVARTEELEVSVLSSI